MKKLLALFSVLVIVFCGTWVFKSKTPSSRPDNSVSAATVAWWNSDVQMPQVDEEWTLDPEIPENYIPVPGEQELYMVVDEEGKIVQYRQREKQEDGSWVWKTVNPDIPDEYIPVDGVKDVYMVKNEDGSVSYLKYIRNDDDTFAFVPCDKNGKIIETNAPSGSEIPKNYVRVSGNIYAVLNENGVIIGYKERRINESGEYYWVDCNKPKQTTNSGSNVSYNSGSPTNNKTNNSGTNFVVPNNPNNSGGNSTGNNNQNNTGGNNSSQVIDNGNGTYTQTESIFSTETTGGWVITYQTIVTRVYANDGTLMSTKKDGPTIINKVKADESGAVAPDKGKVSSTLSGEYARVSVGLNYDTSLASEVVTQINAERSASGLSSLVLSSSSTEGMIAAIRAADMAIYNHSDYDSATYGDLHNMCSMYKVTSSAPSEIVWKTTGGKTSTAIASRLQLMSGALMNSNYSSIGLSIVSKNGYYYIDVILL